MAGAEQKLSGEQMPQTEPGWVEKMHEHYRQNGFYRAQDLERVLGDPREHLEVKTSDEEANQLHCQKITGARAVNGLDNFPGFAASQAGGQISPLGKTFGRFQGLRRRDMG